MDIKQLNETIKPLLEDYGKLPNGDLYVKDHEFGRNFEAQSFWEQVATESKALSLDDFDVNDDSLDVTFEADYEGTESPLFGDAVNRLRDEFDFNISDIDAVSIHIDWEDMGTVGKPWVEFKLSNHADDNEDYIVIKMAYRDDAFNEFTPEQWVADIKQVAETCSLRHIKCE